MSEHPVAELVAGACTVLRAYKHDAIAARAEYKLAGNGQAPEIVVVGEIKRGKSLLVSALVGCDGVALDDVENSTAVTTRFVAASEEFPDGTAELVFADGRHRIDRAELAEWTCTAGRYVNDPAVEALPVAAVVPVASSQLAAVSIIDTPGVGGLDPRHAAMAAQSAEQAAVLVLVCDASTPLTEPEMQFLRESAAGVEHVVVVVTKTDKNLTRWEQIVAENRRAITDHVGRELPVMAVSSVRALAAAALPPSPAKDRALAASGLPALWSLLAQRVTAARRWPEADALRCALDGLQLVERAVAAELTVIRQGDKAVPDLTAEVERLRGLKDEAQQWEQHLQRDLTLARQRAVMRLDEELARVREEWTTRINKSSMQVLRRSPQVFTARIQADLLDAMATTAQVFLDDLEPIVTELFDDRQQWEHIREVTVASLHTEPLVTSEVGSKRQGLLDPSVLTMGMIGTTMLGAVIGAGAIAGVAWVAVNLGFKAMRTGKTNLLTWLRETVAVVRTAATRMLEAAMATTRPEIVLSRRRHLQERITELQHRIDEASRSAQTDAATRAANIERLEKNLRIIRARISPIDTALTTTATAGVA